MKRKGFTILEVVLVLGIAGLIMLMVFVALPALQRSSRDAKRRENMAEFASALKKFQTNNRGALPITEGGDDKNNAVSVIYSSSLYTNPNVDAKGWAGFYRDYLPKTFEDPTGDSYNLSAMYCNTNTVGTSCTGTAAKNTINNIKNKSFDQLRRTINIIIQATCNGGEVVSTANPRNYVILYKLEVGGAYCEGF